MPLLNVLIRNVEPTGPGSVVRVWPGQSAQARTGSRRAAGGRARARIAALAALAVLATLALTPLLNPALAQGAASAAPPRAATPRPPPPPRPAAAPATQSQFAMVPAPMLDQPPPVSAAETEREYRIDAARHLYAAYPMRVFKGQLPPLLYSVMMVETEISREGEVLDISIIRKPAADEVAPWVLAMIRRAGPFPPPGKIDTATVRFTEAWFVDRSGLFQLMSLTEGQR
jgi:periplasmic protein TonB